MVFKGEYMELEKKSRNTNIYVFMDYKLGALIYHFTNLVIGANIQLKTMIRKNSLIPKWWHITRYIVAHYISMSYYWCHLRSTSGNCH